MIIYDFNTNMIYSNNNNNNKNKNKIIINNNLDIILYIIYIK